MEEEIKEKKKHNTLAVRNTRLDGKGAIRSFPKQGKLLVMLSILRRYEYKLTTFVSRFRGRSFTITKGDAV